jgi:hypothetical protein
MTTADYLALIPSANSNAPKFVDTVGVSVSAFVRLQAVLSDLPRAFSVSEAIGVQLDAVGLWVGVSRAVAVPIEGVYFSWDSEDLAEGWDAGVWQGTGQAGAGLNVLPDDSYRALIRARIAANHWDGTVEGAYSAWATAYSASSYLLIQDNQDMTMTLGIGSSVPVNSVTRALIFGGYIPLKPAGVGVDYYIAPPPETVIFGWGPEGGIIGGWGSGDWTLS